MSELQVFATSVVPCPITVRASLLSPGQWGRWHRCNEPVVQVKQSKSNNGSSHTITNAFETNSAKKLFRSFRLTVRQCEGRGAWRPAKMFHFGQDSARRREKGSRRVAYLCLPFPASRCAIH